MNKHISLVKRWLADNDSVTLQELKDNRDSAYADGNVAAETLYAADVAYAASSDAAAAAEAAARAARAAATTAYWFRRYEELTNEK